MSPSETIYSVWIGDSRAGSIRQRGDYTRFILDESYRDNASRPVLGLIFEQDPLKTHSANLRLPPWFSNLLPEGRLREWVADDRGVSVDREMELLAQVGHDLPGAVRVLPANSEPGQTTWENVERFDGGLPLPNMSEQPGWRFSLAGVQLKFSMINDRDRLTLPAHGEGGDWIVKLPDRLYPEVPRNEFTMMWLAGAAGIEIPRIRLIHRDEIQGLPPNAWPGQEEWAFATQRFDRDAERRRVHIEDLSQVCNRYSDDKYAGNYESVASLIYRRRDILGLQQFARRLAFIILITNGDAHLKNWSLIYRDPKIPTLSPAYDLVSTAVYYAGGTADNLALKFGGSKAYNMVSLTTFRALQRRLDAKDAYLPEQVEETVSSVLENWPQAEDRFRDLPQLRTSISESIDNYSKTLMRRLNRY